jgi:hypothetical protein
VARAATRKDARGAKVTNLRLCKAKGSKSATKPKSLMPRRVNRRARQAMLKPSKRVVVAETTKIASAESAEREVAVKDNSQPLRTQKRRKTGRSARLWLRALRRTRSVESRLHVAVAAETSNVSDTTM